MTSMADWLEISEPQVVAQVEILHVMDHKFSKKPGTKHVCGVCGENRFSPLHGAVSYQGANNALSNRFTYQTANKAWQETYLKLLAGVELPRPCRKIEVNGLISFPNKINRDEGNHRFTIEKFLGDALQKGGYLENDDWSSYRFRDLDLAPSKPGQQWTRLMLVGYL